MAGGFLGIKAHRLPVDALVFMPTGSAQHKIKLLADDYTGGQPYFILERTAEEAAQVFVPHPYGAPAGVYQHGDRGRLVPGP